MRQFIISDLHGNINVYKSVMNYLDNLSKEVDVTLFINGDLIDRGSNSIYMLNDVKSRILHNTGFKIEYLAGNHELMMYRASLKIKNGNWPKFCDWYLNGGKKTLNDLENNYSKDEISNIIKFISNLDIYHKFKETINDKPIVLVHAMCPKNVYYECNLKIKDDNLSVNRALWTRKEDSFFKKSLGNEKYFTIIGHTPVLNESGYLYYESDNVINIDGGCAAYECGIEKNIHSPLVEIDSKNNRLIILTFNENNEIVLGNYFSSGKSVKMSEDELNKNREYLKFRRVL